MGLHASGSPQGGLSGHCGPPTVPSGGESPVYGLVFAECACEPPPDGPSRGGASTCGSARPPGLRDPAV
eukprot:5506246-Prorocentrum_lima.AAC.1